MGRLFGERILEFVLSVDIVDEDTFNGVMNLIQSYVVDELRVTNFTVLEETTVDDGFGLRTRWSTGDERPSYTVDKDNGYSAYSSYSYGEKTPLWVISKSGAPLKGAADCVDRWSEREDLPQDKFVGPDIKTSVVHPLRVGDRVSGVVEFETDQMVEFNHVASEEVRLLAMVIARAHQMCEATKAQRANTRKALDLLEESRKEESWKPLELPQIFVAYPEPTVGAGAAPAPTQEVIDAIRSVAHEYDDRLKIVFWQDITAAGDINSHVVDAICRTEFGLCYFSEPTPEGGFDDNSNVLFEAGMMQVLTKSVGAQTKAWIPVREEASPDLPFDIAAERFVKVKREDGKIDPDVFKNDLRDRIDALLK